MKYLIDTNVLFEVALRRKQWREAIDFLSSTPTSQLAVAEFSLFSMGFYLWKTPDTFEKLIQDVRARELHDLRIVSFDSDFDRTPRGRSIPTASP